MSLETILTALGKVMKNDVAAADAPLYARAEVAPVITTYFNEREARPELVALIKSQTLMHEYLALSLGERERLERFRVEHEGYLEGEGNTINPGKKGGFISKNADKVLRKTQYISQVLKLFDFYLEHRKEREVFNLCHLSNNEMFKEKFGNLGENVYANAIRHLKVGFKELVNIVAEQRPEIRNYTTFGNVFQIDGPNQLLRLFEFYLEHRKEGDLFGYDYLMKNKVLKEEFENLGENVYRNAYKHFKGGYKGLVNTVAEQRPEILNYTTKKALFRIDGPNQLLRLFEFYLEHRKEGETFSSNNLKNNKVFKEKFENLGRNVYASAINLLAGGINELVELAAKTHPEILQYWSYNPKNATRKRKDSMTAANHLHQFEQPIYAVVQEVNV